LGRTSGKGQDKTQDHEQYPYRMEFLGLKGSIHQFGN